MELVWHILPTHRHKHLQPGHDRCPRSDSAAKLGSSGKTHMCAGGEHSLLRPFCRPKAATASAAASSEKVQGSKNLASNTAPSGSLPSRVAAVHRLRDAWMWRCTSLTVWRLLRSYHRRLRPRSRCQAGSACQTDPQAQPPARTRGGTSLAVLDDHEVKRSDPFLIDCNAAT